MSKEASPQQKLKLHQLEEQVVGLYSHSLFLREDEEKTLQQAARDLDRHAAFLFLFDSDETPTGHPLGRRIIKLLIEKLRIRKSGRPSDAERLIKMREEAMAYRRAQIKKGFLERCLSSFSFSPLRKRSESMKATDLKVEVASAEARQNAAYQLLSLMFADRFSRPEKNSEQDQVQSMVRAIRHLQELRKKNRMYRKIYSEVRRNSIPDARGLR